MFRHDQSPIEQRRKKNVLKKTNKTEQRIQQRLREKRKMLNAKQTAKSDKKRLKQINKMRE